MVYLPINILKIWFMVYNERGKSNQKLDKKENKYKKKTKKV